MKQSALLQEIPTSLTFEQFERFVLPHLLKRRPGPRPKLSWHAIVNYLLLFLYIGCQWKRLLIRSGADGKPEIHYSRLHRALSFLEAKGVTAAIFVGSVTALHHAGKLDVSVIHGNGTIISHTVQSFLLKNDPHGTLKDIIMLIKVCGAEKVASHTLMSTVNYQFNYGIILIPSGVFCYFAL